MCVARVRTPRSAWIDAALQALATGGPDALRIEPLAVSLGVSKGGFYWHFANRDALIAEMLDAWEQAGTEQVIERIDSEPLDPRAKLQRLFALAPSANFAVELALRDWARRDADIDERLGRIDNRRMAFLRSLFGQFCRDEKDAEARTMLAYSLLIGSYFVAAPEGERTRAQMLGLALDRLLGGEGWD
jgi:AcrR family transcriptional regulator